MPALHEQIADLLFNATLILMMERSHLQKFIVGATIGQNNTGRYLMS
jgi:hypothetical protein